MRSYQYKFDETAIKLISHLLMNNFGLSPDIKLLIKIFQNATPYHLVNELHLFQFSHNL